MDVVHALSDTDGCSEVEDSRSTLERTVYRGWVANVTDVEVDLVCEVPRTLPLFAMHLRHQVVERANGVAVREELVSQMRTDETSASSDENRSFGHDPSLEGRSDFARSLRRVAARAFVVSDFFSTAERLQRLCRAHRCQRTTSPRKNDDLQCELARRRRA
jgi:hypothetical protein